MKNRTIKEYSKYNSLERTDELVDSQTRQRDYYIADTSLREVWVYLTPEKNWYLMENSGKNIEYSELICRSNFSFLKGGSSRRNN